MNRSQRIDKHKLVGGHIFQLFLIAVFPRFPSLPLESY
jgi:hypothetical protein